LIGTQVKGGRSHDVEEVKTLAKKKRFKQEKIKEKREFSLLKKDCLPRLFEKKRGRSTEMKKPKKKREGQVGWFGSRGKGD